MTACSGLNAPETMDRSMFQWAGRSTGLPAGRAVWRPWPVLRLLACHRRWYRCLSSCRCLLLPRGLSPTRRRGTSRPWLCPGPRAPGCYSSRTVMTSVLPIWARVRSNYPCLAKGATSAFRPNTPVKYAYYPDAQPSCIIVELWTTPDHTYKKHAPAVQRTGCAAINCTVCKAMRHTWAATVGRVSAQATRGIARQCWKGLWTVRGRERSASRVGSGYIPVAVSAVFLCLCLS